MIMELRIRVAEEESRQLRQASPRTKILQEPLTSMTTTKVMKIMAWSRLADFKKTQVKRSSLKLQSESEPKSSKKRAPKKMVKAKMIKHQRSWSENKNSKKTVICWSICP